MIKITTTIWNRTKRTSSIQIKMWRKKCRIPWLVLNITTTFSQIITSIWNKGINLSTIITNSGKGIPLKIRSPKHLIRKFDMLLYENISNKLIPYLHHCSSPLLPFRPICLVILIKSLLLVPFISSFLIVIYFDLISSALSFSTV